MPVQKVFVDKRLLIPTDEMLADCVSSILELPSSAEMQAALDEMVARGVADRKTERQRRGAAGRRHPDPAAVDPDAWILPSRDQRRHARPRRGAARRVP